MCSLSPLSQSNSFCLTKLIATQFVASLKQLFDPFHQEKKSFENELQTAAHLYEF